MFRSKTFTVRRRFSDFLGLYEKLSEKHSQNGYIIPPPPEKSILGRNLLLLMHLIWLWASVWLWITVCGFSRYDKSQSGEGGPIVSRVCGAEESCSREVRYWRWQCFLTSCSSKEMNHAASPSFCPDWPHLSSMCHVRRFRHIALRSSAPSEISLV